MRLAATLIAFLTLTAAAQAARWSPVHDIGPGAEDGLVRADGHGGVYLLYAHGTGTEHRPLVFGERGGGGGLFARQRVPFGRLSSGTIAPFDYDFAVTGGGSAIAMFCTGGGDDAATNVRVAVRPRGGRFGQPVDLSPPVTGPDDGGCEVALAAGPRGRAVALWSVETADGATVVETASMTNGRSFGPAAVLSTDPRGGSADPLAAISRSGRATLAWRNGGSECTVRDSAPVRCLGAASAERGSEEHASGLAVAPDGSAALAFEGDGRVKVSTAMLDGPFGPAVTAGRSPLAEPRVAIGARDGVAVLWRDSRGRPTVRTGSMGRAVKLGGPTPAPRSTNAYQHAVSIDGHGRVTVAWFDGHSVAVRTPGKPAQRYPAPGLEQLTQGADSRGDAIVAWTNADGLSATTRTGNGRFGPARRVASGLIIDPSVTFARSRQALLAWRFNQGNRAAIRAITATF